jgi:hypothetical protein
MLYFTEVMVDGGCDCGVSQVSMIVRTKLPLAEHLKQGIPYAYSSINPESGDVYHYDPTKDTHADGPAFVNFEHIVREVPYEERLALFEKIRERDQKHTGDALVFLLSQ